MAVRQSFSLVFGLEFRLQAVLAVVVSEARPSGRASCVSDLQTGSGESPRRGEIFMDQRLDLVLVRSFRSATYMSLLKELDRRMDRAAVL